MASADKSSNRSVTIAIEAAIVLVALLLFVLIRTSVYMMAIVTSGSMEPTLKISDRMLVDHRASLHGSWQRGDIVLFKEPDSWEDTMSETEAAQGNPTPQGKDELVKRIVGLPGETLDVYPDKVIVNGRQLNEPYANSITNIDPIRVVLGPKQYYVLGDNRSNSDDSRFHGPIEDKDIIGRTIAVIGPPGRWQKFSTPEYGF